MPRLLSGLVAALMVGQSLAGLALPGTYRDPAWVRAAWTGNDWVTLGVAAPALVAVLRAARHGSARTRLLWAGLLGYGAYNYAYYLLGAELNASFPVYVLGVLLSASALILLLRQIRPDAITAGSGAGVQRRLVGGYLASVGLCLAVVWLGMWAGYVFAGRATPVEPDAFRLVAALDLSLMVPALVCGGVLLWRNRPWGYVLAAIAGVQGSLYLLVLSAGSLVAIRRGLVTPPGELPIWGALALVTSAATSVLVRHAGGPVGPGATAPRDAAVARASRRHPLHR